MAREADPNIYMIEQVRAYIAAHPEQPISIERLAQQLHYSRRQLQRIFRWNVAMTPNEYQNLVRLCHAVPEIAQTQKPLRQIAADNGYSSPALFRRAFRKQFGCTPAEYRRNSALLKPQVKLTVADLLYRTAEEAGSALPDCMPLYPQQNNCFFADTAGAEEATSDGVQFSLGFSEGRPELHVAIAFRISARQVRSLPYLCFEAEPNGAMISMHAWVDHDAVLDALLYSNTWVMTPETNRLCLCLQPNEQQKPMRDEEDVMIGVELHRFSAGPYEPLRVRRLMLSRYPL